MEIAPKPWEKVRLGGQIAGTRQSFALGIPGLKNALNLGGSFFSSCLALLLPLDAVDELLEAGPAQLIELD